MKKLLFLFIIIPLISSCGNDGQKENIQKEQVHTSNTKPSIQNDTIIKSKKHKFEEIICDLDGDNLKDSVQIVLNTINKKYGLKISYGKNRVDYLGMGKNVINQGFDDFDWIGIFEKANKGEIYWSNVDEDGAIITDENEIKDEDKITLQNDGIYVHQAESCGGGIIYLNGDKYSWIQQE